MLTKEVLINNNELGTLTDEQISVIEALSRNDEDVVIGRKTREIHDSYDNDIKSVLGVDKPHGVKSYEHLKNVLSDLNEKAKSAEGVTDLQNKIQSLTVERDNLLRSGQGDESLKSRVVQLEQSLKDKHNELDVFKNTLTAEKETLLNQLSEKQNEFKALRLSSEIDNFRAAKGLKFNTAIPDDVLNDTEKLKRNNLINSVTVDKVTHNGKELQVLRDANGDIIRNSENNNEPITIGELYAKEVGSLLDKTEQRSGTGTKSKGGQTAITLDLSGVKNQVEADTMIANYLMSSEGLTKLSPKWQERKTTIREENKVKELPIQ